VGKSQFKTWSGKNLPDVKVMTGEGLMEIGGSFEREIAI
jgi:hypothetical protein